MFITLWFIKYNLCQVIFSVYVIEKNVCFKKCFKNYNISIGVVFHCYDCGFISAKTNGPDFGIEFDVVC